MKFGIIVCSKCKKIKVVELFKKTTKCHRCGKILKLETNEILYKTDSIYKARQIVGIVNAEKDGKSEEFIKTITKSI